MFLHQSDSLLHKMHTKILDHAKVKYIIRKVLFKKHMETRIQLHIMTGSVPRDCKNVLNEHSWALCTRV